MKMTIENPENTSIVLPGEIMNDIFSRLPVKPVFQLQCLSKNFSSITKDRSFIDAHLKHSARLRPSLILNKGRDIFLIRSNEVGSETTVEEVPLHKNIVLTNSNTKFKILGSCNGLCAVYVYDITIGEFKDDCFLLNRSANKCDQLPSPGRILGGLLETAAWGFGYCTESRVYKIVRIAYFTSQLSFFLEDVTNSKLLVEILTYGTDPVWRKLDFRKYSELCLGHEISNAHGITVKGVVYWKPTFDKQNECNLILTFDLEKEKFAWILCPVTMEGQTMQFKDSLAICAKSKDNQDAYELWVLKNVMCNAAHHDVDDDVYSIVNESFWEKVYTTDALFPRTIPLGCLSDSRLLLTRT